MEDSGGKVRVLIEKATNSTAAHVDSRLLKAIKTVVRYSDSELRIAAQTLMDLMKRDHSQIRYLSLLIIDELFMRSKLFRTLIVENLDQLLSLSVGFRRNLPLPAPPAVASVLRAKAIEFLEKWNSSFGINYRKIRLGFDYLKNILRFQFPNLQANAARIQQERRERAMKSMEILRNKFEMLMRNFTLIKEEIHSTVDEINECLEIVRSKGESLPFVPLGDEDFDEFRPSELRQLRIDSLKEAEKIQENSENKVVFDALRELYKLLVRKHLVSVQEWISVLIRVELADNRSRDSMLKEFIDIRNSLQSVKKKCMESGCSLQETGKHPKDEEEEDFWEEGKIEPSEIDSSNIPAQTSKKLLASTCEDSKIDTHKRNDEKSEIKIPVVGERGSTDSNPLRSKLMAEAPVMKWGSHLDNWGPKRDVMVNHRGLEFENHWGRVEYDAVIPAEKIAELSMTATPYKEEQVEIPQCRAPLRKGGLCQRRDLRVCPFHGPVVPRDGEGNPLHQSPVPNNLTNQSTMTDDINFNSGDNLAEKLAKKAVKNVRDRDQEVSRKRKVDKQLEKRAKLAKIREHNESVLQHAAIASSSHSAFSGEEAEAASEERLLAREKKETLSSMLHKKVTTKERLSKRLLSTRASDATTRQLTIGEDAAYREAFPNQW